MKGKQKNKTNSHRVKYTETDEEGLTFDFAISELRNVRIQEYLCS